MPPIRTNKLTPVVSMAKPMKTERTHEENQERCVRIRHSHFMPFLTIGCLRAYIAASRRSDRSLEARVESARRASAIHKQRTGRGLRVTEQDVLNEEMYEEEDDDLPTQYRRLAAHINTESELFNRRFHAFIQSAAGARMAFSQMDPSFAAGAAMQQQYPYSTALNPLQIQQMQSPKFAHGVHGQQQSPMQAMPSPLSPLNYSMTAHQPATHNFHQRSASIATPECMPNFTAEYSATLNHDDQRRLSMPANALAVQPASKYPAAIKSDPEASKTARTASGAQPIKSETPILSPTALASSSQGGTPAPPQLNDQPATPFFPSTLGQTLPGDSQFNSSPFSFSLPMEAQQAIAPVFNQSGFPSGMMGSSNPYSSHDPYSYHLNAPLKPSAADPTTIKRESPGPSSLADTPSSAAFSSGNYSTMSAVANDSLTTPYTSVFSSTFGVNDDYSNNDDLLFAMKPAAMSRNDSTYDANVDWDSYIDLGANPSPWDNE